MHSDNEAFKINTINYQNIRSISNETINYTGTYYTINKDIYYQDQPTNHTHNTQKIMYCPLSHIRVRSVGVHERPSIQNISFGFSIRCLFYLLICHYENIKMQCVYGHRVPYGHIINKCSICILIYDAIIAPQFPINSINSICDAA